MKVPAVYGRKGESQCIFISQELAYVAQQTLFCPVTTNKSLPDHLKQGCQTYFTWWAAYSPQISIVIGEKITFCHFIVLILTLIINYFVIVYWPLDRFLSVRKAVKLVQIQSKVQGLCQIEVILAPRPYI